MTEKFTPGNRNKKNNRSITVSRENEADKAESDLSREPQGAYLVAGGWTGLLIPLEEIDEVIIALRAVQSDYEEINRTKGQREIITDAPIGTIWRLEYGELLRVKVSDTEYFSPSGGGTVFPISMLGNDTITEIIKPEVVA